MEDPEAFDAGERLAQLLLAPRTDRPGPRRCVLRQAAARSGEPPVSDG
jgi:hypothetical protein